MLQFYFLSILLNLLAGLILVYGTDFYKKSEGASSSSDDFEASDEVSEDAEGEESFDEETDFSDDSDEKSSKFAKNNTILDDSTFRLIIGILGFMTAILKLCSPAQGGQPVVGDLLPFVAGVVSSLILLLEFFNTKSSTGIELPAPVETIVSEGRRYIGIFCILVAVLHFVCPKILFL